MIIPFILTLNNHDLQISLLNIVILSLLGSSILLTIRSPILLQLCCLYKYITDTGKNNSFYNRKRGVTPFSLWHKK